jgi:ElaB/YqjD/DUF883 family membrane-anchored ribosome-binding protein
MIRLSPPLTALGESAEIQRAGRRIALLSNPFGWSSHFVFCRSLCHVPGRERLNWGAGTGFLVQEETMRTALAGGQFAESVHKVKSAKAAMSAAVDDGKEAARRAVRRVRRGIRAVEDLEEDALHEVRRHPGTTVALSFGVGMGVGLLLGWFLARTRS